MKINHFSFFIVSVFVISLFFGCSGNKSETKQASVAESSVKVKTPLAIWNETLLLLKDLADNGDYVNSKDYPSMIKASIVNENLGKDQLVIDLRTTEQFSKGHIKGAINKKFSELPQFFETGIKPFEFDKIIIACNDGQLSCYTTSLLRLMGYGNVYAMRWGMSAWNNKYAQEGWLKDVSGKFEANLELKINERPSSKGMPELNTGKGTGEDIAKERFRKLFEEGTSNIFISADEVFSNPQKYFIINWDRKDKYEDGHIPGALRYKPDATLGFPEEMASVSYDRIVVIYCGSGHMSGFATAYFRLFGYDARTLKYGNNSFMYNKMVKQRQSLGWVPFTSDDINNFEVVK
jgi:rhodanese-related sulfurtransferase